jgi:ABC-2 type transport system ATP-binding protein
MSAEILLSLRDARKHYSGRLALACKHLDVIKGNCLAVEGGNGSGKSTLLRVLARVIDLDQGELACGEAWNTARIAYYPQSGGLYGNLTVRENLARYQRLFGLRRSLELAEQLLPDDEFRPYLDTPVAKLSGGAQRLAGLRLALSLAADVLILDEPAAELSASYVQRLAGTISRISGQYLAVVLAEHSPEIVAAANQRIKLPAP